MSYDDRFYGADLAVIHHDGFGDIARAAAGLLLALLDAAGARHGTVIDLACGTGILPRIVADAGYDTIGFDLSSDMLELARTHAPRTQLEQRSLYDERALPRAVAFAANGEALNYAADPRAGLDGLAGVARRVRAAIDPAGIFLFDVATPGRAGPSRVRDTVREAAGWTISARSVENETRTALDRSMTFTRESGGHTTTATEHHVCHLYEPRDVLDVMAEAGFATETRLGYADEPTESTPPGGWLVVIARPSQ